MSESNRPSRCWRLYACGVCGCRYRCLIRTEWPEPDDEEAEDGDGGKPLAEVSAKRHPCPDCAAVPGGGVEAARRHGRIAALAALCMTVAALCVFYHSIGRYWTAVCFGLVAFLSALGHVLVIAAQIPESRARVRQAECSVAEGRVRVVEDGEDSPSYQRRVRLGVSLSLTFALLAVPVCLSPVVLVEVVGWPRLKTSNEEVISPGDKVKVWLGGSVLATGGKWSGQPKVVVLNAKEFGGQAELRATSQHDTWGGAIQVSKNASTSTSPLWVEIAIPNDPEWAEKKILAQVELTIRYPGTAFDITGRKFTNIDTLYTEKVEIPVAPPGAGEAYRASWWFALLGGALPAILVGLILRVLTLAATPPHQRARSRR